MNSLNSDTPGSKMVSVLDRAAKEESDYQIKGELILLKSRLKVELEILSGLDDVKKARAEVGPIILDCIADAIEQALRSCGSRERKLAFVRHLGHMIECEDTD